MDELRGEAKMAQVHEEATSLQEYIELNRFMKLCGLAQSGGEAKRLVDEGMVRVNGEPESRRRRKLRRGDTVSLAGETESVDDYTESVDDYVELAPAAINVPESDPESEGA
jgi:ribosome-associated protein